MAKPNKENDLGSIKSPFEHYKRLTERDKRLTERYYKKIDRGYSWADFSDFFATISVLLCILLMYSEVNTLISLFVFVACILNFRGIIDWKANNEHLSDRVRWAEEILKDCVWNPDDETT